MGAKSADYTLVTDASRGLACESSVLSNNGCFQKVQTRDNV